MIGLRPRKEIAYVQEFEKNNQIPRSLLGGITRSVIQICPRTALLRRRADISRWTEITDPGNRIESPRLTPSQMSFKELVTGRGREITQAQQKG